jgi:hypothetical protein
MPYPELIIDWNTHPQLADNIWQAQSAGWPKILTYNGPDPFIRRQTRRAAMHYDVAGIEYEIPHILSRDEYPFACTVEGGSSWVGHIPGRENSAQGGMIAAFLRRNHIVAGRGAQSRFVVTVINHPNGPVATP